MFSLAVSFLCIAGKNKLKTGVINVPIKATFLNSGIVTNVIAPYMKKQNRISAEKEIIALVLFIPLPLNTHVYKIPAFNTNRASIGYIIPAPPMIIPFLVYA